MWVYITIVFTYLTIARLFLLNVILYFNFLKLIANIYGNCGIISLKVTLFLLLTLFWPFYFLNTKMGFHTLSSCVISLMSLLYILAQTGIWFLLGTFVFTSIRYWQGFHCYNCYWHFNSYFINSSWLSLHSLSSLSCHNWIWFFAPLFIVIVNAAHIFSAQEVHSKIHLSQLD